MAMGQLRRAFALMLVTALALGGLGIATAPAARAQALFAPVLYVNDKAITAYELDQRMLFQNALSSPGGEKAALTALTNERLQLDMARRMRLELTPEEQLKGETEFAARGGLEREQFLKLLAQAGVAEESFRDFVKAGLLWRKIVREKFGSVTNITQRDVDLALSPTSQRAGVRLLFSEIFLPARNPEEQSNSNAIAAQIMETESLNQFAAYARQYSVAPTGPSGGRVNWVDAANLPGPLAAQLSALQIGQVAGPLSTGQAIGLFQLRGIQETAPPKPDRVMVDYAAYYMAGGRSPATLARAEKLRGEVQICNDLYGVAQGQPESVLERGEKNLTEVPQDVAIELAKLDENEISTALTRSNGQTLVFLMLCTRRNESNAPDWTPPESAQVREQLLNARLGAKADLYLAELRANADIREP